MNMMGQGAEQDNEIEFISPTTPHKESMAFFVDCTTNDGVPHNRANLLQGMHYILQGLRPSFPPNFTLSVSGIHKNHIYPMGNDPAADTLELKDKVKGQGTMRLKMEVADVVDDRHWDAASDSLASGSYEGEGLPLKPLQDILSPTVLAERERQLNLQVFDEQQVNRARRQLSFGDDNVPQQPHFEGTQNFLTGTSNLPQMNIGTTGDGGPFHGFSIPVVPMDTSAAKPSSVATVTPSPTGVPQSQPQLQNWRKRILQTSSRETSPSRFHGILGNQAMDQNQSQEDRRNDPGLLEPSAQQNQIGETGTEPTDLISTRPRASARRRGNGRSYEKVDCPVCEKRISTRSNLKRHLERIHHRPTDKNNSSGNSSISENNLLEL